MSEENKVPTEQQVTDLSEKDLQKIVEFKNAGLPGLATLSESTAYRMMDMYLSGSTYWQISSALNVPRVLVTYLSHTHDWYGARREYLNELQEQIKGRVIDSKLVSQDFLLLLTQAWQKKIGKKLQKYLSTDDEMHTDDIDLKEVAQLLKTIDMVNNLGKDGTPKDRAPAVGLNLGSGVTIERQGDNKVTITPKDNTLGDMLKKFADSRRAEANKEKTKSTSDIEVKEHKNEE